MVEKRRYRKVPDLVARARTQIHVTGSRIVDLVLAARARPSHAPAEVDKPAYQTFIFNG